ncbi:MAG: CHAP domain-containing protein [Alphaproteobacteria bacterium]|nr:CHAP domain-containing protein [Alphaproteobacteria bacterium]
MVDVKIGTLLNTKCGDLLTRNTGSMSFVGAMPMQTSIFQPNYFSFPQFNFSDFNIFNSNQQNFLPLNMPLNSSGYNSFSSVDLMRMAMPIMQLQSLYGSESGSFGSLSNSSNSYSSQMLAYSGPKNPSGLIGYSSSFIGKVNSDREGNRLFSGGVNQAWCADFVTHCVKHVYGDKTPSWFGSSRVYRLKEQARLHNAYIQMPTSGKASFIANNIKPGDIMVQLKAPSGDCSGHTGVVEKVNSDGSFFCVEGNSSNKVQRVRYKPDNKILRGFIRV